MPPRINPSQKLIRRGGLQMIEQSTMLTPLLIKDLGMLYPKETSKQKNRYGLYKCNCGAEFKAPTRNVKQGFTLSCGCYQKALLITHGLLTHRLYKVWSDIIGRTNNVKCKAYKYYGGRGIKICDRWLDVANFI